ncbi:hypothetical protein C8Q76DRAFT_798159 [Earliella scabrosa]|nr:hypothetical protein C8Q76DRAFT_798159 [Earliella scabrosa]
MSSRRHRKRPRTSSSHQESEDQDRGRRVRAHSPVRERTFPQVPAGEQDASTLPRPRRSRELSRDQNASLRGRVSLAPSGAARRLVREEMLESPPPVGEGFSTDEGEEQSDSSSSPPPVGETSSSQCSPAILPRLQASCPQASRSAVAVDGAMSSASSESSIGPVGESGDSDEEGSETSVPTGESSNDAGATSRRSASSRCPAAHAVPGTRVNLAALNNERSPTPLTNPPLSPRVPQPEPSSISREQKLLEHRETIEWFEKEISRLRRSASILSQTPESRIASRTEYWEIYNRILGARGSYRHAFWRDFTDDDA